MNLIGDLPYFELEADSTGALIDSKQPGLVTSFLAAHPIRHLFVISHGWNSTPGAARDLYRRFFTQFGQTLAAHPSPGIAANQCAVAGVLWPSEQFTADLLQPFNLTTYYRMKARAGLVGQIAVAGALDRIRAAASALRIHLIGHSFGGRVVSSAALAAAQPVDSLTLLQGAFSQNSFSPDYDSSHQPGFFRAVVTGRKCGGPLLVTHSVHDRAIGVGYSIASLIARQNGSALSGVVDPYAGLGHNGARNTPEATDGDLQPEGSPYALKTGGIFNLNADRIIFGHGDVVKPETAWAVLAATRLTEGERIQSCE